MPESTARATSASTAALTMTSIRAKPSSERGVRGSAIENFIDRSERQVEWGEDRSYQRLPSASGVTRQEPIPGLLQVRTRSPLARRRTEYLPPVLAAESTVTVNESASAVTARPRAWLSTGSIRISSPGVARLKLPRSELKIS